MRRRNPNGQAWRRTEVSLPLTRSRPPTGGSSGAGFSGTLEFFSQQLGVPTFLAVLVILAESLGSISLIVGFLSRFCAFGIGMVMLGAVFMLNLQHGFFMNWSGQAQGEGIEYHILALGLVLAILFKGGGKWSIDRLLTERL